MLAARQCVMDSGASVLEVLGALVFVCLCWKETSLAGKILYVFWPISAGRTSHTEMKGVDFGGLGASVAASHTSCSLWASLGLALALAVFIERLALLAL